MAKNKVPTVMPDPAWRAEEDLHHMTHAEEVRRDPKRLEAVKKLAVEKKSHLSRVAATQPRAKPASRKAK